MNVSSIRHSQNGQTLLIVVLVMVVALTVGLAVATRSITNLRTTQEEAASQRAFSAAEAGVEQALKGTILTDKNLGNNSIVKQVTISEMAEDSKKFIVNGGNVIAQNDGADIWLVGHNADGSVNYSSPLTVNPLIIYWSLSDDCNAAALEIIVISGSLASPKSTRYAYDGCSSRASSNKFTLRGSGSNLVGGKTLKYQTSSDINITDGLVVRVIPVYANTVIGVATPNSNAGLPSQGKKISSTGTSGGTVRKITFLQGYPKLPAEFFQYVLLSP